MKQSFPKLLLVTIFLLGIALSGVGSAFRVYSMGAVEVPPSSPVGPLFSVAAQAASPTSTPAVQATATPTLLLPVAPQGGSSVVYAFIEAPRGALPYPYVVLSGFHSGSFASDLQIVGTLNVTDFTCPGSPCVVPLELGESRIVFKSVLGTGESSDSVFALVWAEQQADGYHVKIESVSQFFGVFGDACLAAWKIEDDTYPSWAEFPQYPYQLNTQTSLHNLAAQLIVHGEVDTKDCPAGGMSSDLTWPNGCGMEKARNAMIQWQNQYDEAIWTAGNEVGIPPKILKTLIQVESQFWPENSRFYLDEYGLGQVNELGVDVLLRKDNTLYQQACSMVLTSCTTPYGGLSPVEQALVRGALLTSQNASCPSCDNGLDLTRAKQSVNFIAQVLRANCQQVKATMDARKATSDYENLWKFTLLSYHSGMSCLSEAVKEVKADTQPVDWEHVADKLKCKGGREYVDGFWVTLTNFDNYRYDPGGAPIVEFSPVLAPTRTPLPSPTPVTSIAKVWVGVYMDANGDGIPQPEEGLSDIPVQLQFPDGRIISGRTVDGQATFDLAGEMIGTRIVASLPGLYREYVIYLPQSGTVPVLFMFTQPVLPGKLP
jgi:hypothetical protein